MLVVTALLLGVSTSPDVRAPIDTAQPSAVGVTRSAFGLTERDGRLQGAGPGYRVALDAAGFEYTPALGSGAPETHTLSFTLSSIARGDTTLAIQALGVEPTRDAASAQYARGAGVTEIYTLRADGVEQSFRFDAPPAGSGDLVVRGALTSSFARSLEGQPLGAGLAFDVGAGRSITLGGVTGVDALGRTSAGTLELSDGVLELRLPGDFVSAAAYPLVLDPLIGTSFDLGEGTSSHLVDVAFDSYSDVWLATWQLDFSATDSWIVAQRFDGTAQLVGGLAILADSSFGHVSYPSVAGSGAYDNFIIAWHQAGAIHCATVRGVDGWVSSPLQLPASGSCGDPDVGAGWTAADVHAIVVYSDTGAGVRAAFVVPTYDGPPVYVTHVDFYSSGFNSSPPEISKSGGNTGTYAIVWGYDNDIYGAVVENDSTVTVSPFSIYPTADNEFLPNVDAFSNVIVVSWTVDRLVGLDDLVCASFHVDATAGTVTPFASAPAVVTSTDNVLYNAVGYDNTMVWIAWSEMTLPMPGAVKLAQMSLMDNQICLAPEIVESGIGFEGRVEIATRQQGGDVYNSQLLLGWSEYQLGAPFEADVRAQFVDSSGGPVVPLGYGCGGGGDAVAIGQAIVGNSGFYVGLSNNDPSAVLGILNLALPGAPTIGCGACTWIPFEITFSAPLSPDPSTSYENLPIPCDLSLAGAAVDFQWTVLFTTDTPCPLFDFVSLSNAIEVTIGL